MSSTLLSARRYAPQIIIEPSGKEGIWAAGLISKVANAKHQQQHPFVLSPATGSSPRATYKCLKRAQESGDYRFGGKDSLVMLDNYLLEPGHPKGYDTEVYEQVCKPLGISIDQLIRIPTQAEDNLDSELKKFDQLEVVNNITVQLLGIGEDGHIGFIPPRRSEIFALEKTGVYIHEGTRVVKLSESTRAANARFFDSIEDVPKEAVTRRAGSILKAQVIIIFVNSFKKAMPAYAAMNGPVCMEVPASLLQLHPNVVWIFSEDASEMLIRSEEEWRLQDARIEVDEYFSRIANSI